MPKTLALLFGLRARVPRRPYIAWGLGLAVAKFLIDTAIVYGFSHRTWSPLGYVVPSSILRDQAVGSAPEGMPCSWSSWPCRSCGSASDDVAVRPMPGCLRGSGWGFSSRSSIT